MEIPHSLTHVFWVAVIFGGSAIVCIVLGLTFLLGQLPIRRVGLRLVWISTAMLAASLIALVMVLTSR